MSLRISDPLAKTVLSNFLGALSPWKGEARSETPL